MPPDQNHWAPLPFERYGRVRTGTYAGYTGSLEESILDFWSIYPRLGEHSEYVYKEMLGMSTDEIADLIAKWVYE